MVMNMNILTKSCPTETCAYSDEVLNANWLPQAMLAALGLPPSRTRTRQTRVSGVHDPENFLARLYRAQE